jgi:Cu/Ag efflux protein CusF
MKTRFTIFAIVFAGLGVVSTAAFAVDGQVQKIDEAQGKITIKHGPLTNLDMPAMTMVFKAGDPAMLKQVKVGDKIKFEADKVDGAITVVKMQKAK